MQIPCFEMARAAVGASAGCAAQPSGLLEQARKPDQEHGADDRDDDSADQAAGVDAERAQEPATHNRTDYAEDNIGNSAVAAALHDLAGSPACDQSNNDPPDQVREHVILP